MSAFVAQVAGRAPLQIQLGARFQTQAGVVDVVQPGMIIELEASSAGDPEAGFVGEASRPIFFRPDTPGYVTDPGLIRYGQPMIGNVQVINNGPGYPNSRGGYLADFSVAPGTPPVAASATNLPIRVRWLFPPRKGIFFTDFFVFYAASSNNHNWNGRIVWEER